MSLSGLIRRTFAALSPLAGDCAGCRHFATDARRIERDLPGLSALASAHSSVWDRGGLCMRHDRIINGRRRCAAFVARI